MGVYMEARGIDWLSLSILYIIHWGKVSQFNPELEDGLGWASLEVPVPLKVQLQPSSTCVGSGDLNPRTLSYLHEKHCSDWAFSLPYTVFITF